MLLVRMNHRELVVLAPGRGLGPFEDSEISRSTQRAMDYWREPLSPDGKGYLSDLF